MTSTDLQRLRARVLEARRDPAPLDAPTQALVLAHRTARDAGQQTSDLVVTRTGEITTVDQLAGQTRGVSRVPVPASTPRMTSLVVISSGSTMAAQVRGCFQVERVTGIEPA